ncbi:tRNA pseudouridine(55) synthase [Olsenella profusa F0195]|uniref:tRNA pseudouridine synthase B n=1 Tax=Olsenella profusa F0195 TaxID=1125712 RepID=U2TL52_9ACTN|nr:tRNA pseudouridine(55) synthase [Olsenella profusa F0195]
MRRGPAKINRIIALDKPLGMTSHDVVARVRRAVGERRVGHAGTLDPAATGVLVVGIGQATRLLGRLALDRKGYDARILFGSETATEDAEGEVTHTAPVPDELRDEACARSALDRMVGPQSQVPPAYSAISVRGRRAYEVARSGGHVDLAPRGIEVFEATLLGIDGSQGVAWDVHFEVSKGTYVRSLARDLGRAVGSAAHLAGLRRTSAGVVALSQCGALPALETGGLSALDACTVDPISVLGALRRDVTEAEARLASCGQALAASSDAASGATCALVHGGLLVGLAEIRDGRLRPRLNFPQGIEGVR